MPLISSFVGCSAFREAVIALMISVDTMCEQGNLRASGTYLFHCMPPLYLDGMNLDPGKKLIPLEGPKQGLVSVVFAVIASWGVVGGGSGIISGSRRTIVVVFLLLNLPLPCAPSPR
jgi:hypothetical protein